MPTGKNVFINCPFDDAYWNLFRAIIFTIIRMGYSPRFSLERADSGEPRITKIIELIEESDFGIHDLSRCKARKKGELFRLNMPLELGLFLGAKHFGGGRHKAKKLLVLEEERYRFQAAISDISNSDIKAHEGKPDQVVRIVRDWLVQEAQAKPLSPTVIWYEYNDCIGQVYDSLRREGYSDKDVSSFSQFEFSQRMINWVAAKSNL